MTKKNVGSKKSSKGRTMDLSTFNATFSNENEGSNWADEMEDQEPETKFTPTTSKTATTTSSTTSAQQGITLDELRKQQEEQQQRKVKPSAFFSEGMKQPSKELEFPTERPFVAYVGNLSYDTTSEGLEEFFDGLEVVNVRLPRDQEQNRIKGFGYVEFETLDDLKEAITYAGKNFLGRPIRVDVVSREQSSKFQSRNTGGHFERNNRFERREEKVVPNSIADKSDNWRGGGGLDNMEINPFGSSSKRRPGPPKTGGFENRPPRTFGNRNNEEKGEESSAFTFQKRVESKPKSNPFGEGKAWTPREKDIQLDVVDETKFVDKKKPKEQHEETTRKPRQFHNNNRQHHSQEQQEETHNDEEGFQTKVTKPRGGRKQARGGFSGLGFNKSKGGNKSRQTEEHHEEGEEATEGSNNPYAALNDEKNE
ncbi:hypothetical protein ABK040_014051 [Willaertia magna]